MESKKIIVTMCDVDTGEVLGCINYFNHHIKRVVPLWKAKSLARAWFDSFMRGLDTKDQHNLCLTITIRDSHSASDIPVDVFAKKLNNEPSE